MTGKISRIYLCNSRVSLLLSPWILGGYSGSNNLFSYLISNEDCLKLKVHGLTEPNTKLSISQNKLLEIGIDIKNKNYYKRGLK